MSDDALRTLLEVQAFFRLPSVGLVEKDLHVVRAIAALVTLDATPFTLVFGGGTALARAHRLIRRMSEDVDFKIVPLTATPVSRSGARRQLSRLHADVSATLLRVGFVFDPKDAAAHYAMDSNRYAVWHLPYDVTDAGQGLRPTIKIELNHVPLRRSPVMLPVRSFVAEAMDRPPEVTEIPCVSMLETVAEKLVSLTRRTAMELAGAGREPDPTLVRHIYDIHMLRDLVDAAEVVDLARIIAKSDAAEFANQFPAYAADIPGETRKAVDALRTDPPHRERYARFVADMVYGERAEFDAAITTVSSLVEHWLSGPNVFSAT